MTSISDRRRANKNKMMLLLIVVAALVVVLSGGASQAGQSDEEYVHQLWEVIDTLLISVDSCTAIPPSIQMKIEQLRRVRERDDDDDDDDDDDNEEEEEEEEDIDLNASLSPAAQFNSCSNTTSCIYDSLIAFYNSTQGNGWIVNRNWGDTTVSWCDWYGLVCDPFESIVALNIRENNVDGVVPTALFNAFNTSTFVSLDFRDNVLDNPFPWQALQILTQLTYFNIGLNGKLSGSIPPLVFSDMLNLQNVQMFSSSLTGAIPVIDHLIQMNFWDCNYAFFTGSLPRDLSRLTRLNGFYMRNNLLTGSIPVFASFISPLQRLDFTENFFSGSVSTQFGVYPNLEYILLGRNRLTGTIPIDLFAANFPGVSTLFLYENMFSSSIPSSIASITGLLELAIYQNQLTGTICTEFGRMTSLVYLNIGRNDFTGTIPSELFQMRRLITFLIDRNLLTAAIPPQISQLTLCTYIGIDQNLLTSTIPTSVGALNRFLTSFVASDNRLTGPIPTEIGRMTRLTFLSLFDNFISGEIPSHIGLLTALEKITLDANVLSSTLPASLFNPNNAMVSFTSSLNSITGEIPSTVGHLTQCLDFSLSDNLLQGTIPSEMARMTNLINLIFNRNAISGRIPGELSALTKATILAFPFNRLSGSIPSSLGTGLSSLKTLDLEDNLISGGLPLGMATTWVNIKFLFLAENLMSESLPDDLFYSLLPTLNTLDMSFNSLNMDCSAFFNLWINAALDPSATQRIFSLFDHDLIILKLRGNFLFGTIPSNLQYFGGIINLDLSANKLSGPLFSQLYAVNWVNIDISDNIGLVGPVPWAFSELVSLKISGTSLGGQFNPALLVFSEQDYSQNNVADPFVCPRVVRIDGRPVLVELDSSTFHNNSLCICSSGYFGSGGVCLSCPSWCDCATYAENPEAKLISHVSRCYPVRKGADADIVAIAACPQAIRTGEDICHVDEETGLFECSEGYAGRLCSRCESGYFLEGRECKQCDYALTKGLITVTFLALLALVAYFHMQSVSGNVNKTGTLKILFFHLQSMFVLIQSSANWSASTLSLFEFGFSVGSATKYAGLDCYVVKNLIYTSSSVGTDAVDTDYQDNQTQLFIWNLFFPFLIVGAVTLIYSAALTMITRLKDRTDQQIQEQQQQQKKKENGGLVSLLFPSRNSMESFKFVMLSLIFLVYFYLATQVFEILGCTLKEAGSTGDYYLNAHPWFKCADERGLNDGYIPIMLLNLLIFFPIVIGMPVYVLMKVREFVLARNGSEADNDDDGPRRGSTGRSSLSRKSSSSSSSINIKSSSSISNSNNSEKSSGGKGMRASLLHDMEEEHMMASVAAAGDDADADADDDEIASMVVKRRMRNGWMCLTGCYKSEYYYFEFVLLARRFCFAFAVNMIPFDATVTVVVTITLLLLASILIQHECKPFLFGFDNVLELSSLYLLLLSYITGLVTVIADDISLVLELFLIIPHVCLVSVMAVIIFLDIFRSDSDDDWKRLSALPLTMRRSVAAFFSLHK